MNRTSFQRYVLIAAMFIILNNNRKNICIKMLCYSHIMEYCAVIKNDDVGASLVAQWLRICLLMQGTWVRALVWEDPTCRGATRPMSHNY